MLVCVGLVLLVVVPYAQVARHEFITCDDSHYLYENAQVMRGLTRDGFHWAFAAPHAGNWHPLTWLSHMLDCDWFRQADGRQWEGGHHLVNVALHAANAVLLFLALRAMTGGFLSCAVIAALFAVHPLRVESVAWASERKDVLSGLFWTLTLLGYAWYARRPGMLRYLLVAAALALGLMAKSMLVTLPCVLLLLDFWPLGRWRRGGGAGRVSPPREGRRSRAGRQNPKSRSEAPSAGPRPASPFPPRSLGWLVAEKLPLLALSCAASLMALYSQRIAGSLNTSDNIPRLYCLCNALVSYVAYLGKTVWPAGLAIFYPHPAILPGNLEHVFAVMVAPALISGVVLAVVTWAIILLGRRRPFLMVGWFWYLGALVPVIGLIQVGTQAMADRYTYLPLIGIYLIVVGVGAEIAARRRPARTVLLIGTPLVIFALTVVTSFQVRHWRNNYTLYEHGLEVTEDNYFLHNELARAYDKDGQEDKAEAGFRQALEIKPNYDFGLNNLGAIYGRPHRQEYEKAEKCFVDAIRINPRYADALHNLALVRVLRHNYDGAILPCEQVIGLRPDDPSNYITLGNAQRGRGRLLEAAAAFEDALRLDPYSPDAHYFLGVVRADQGNTTEAVKQFTATLQINPQHPGAKRVLAELQAPGGRMP